MTAPVSGSAEGFRDGSVRAFPQRDKDARRRGEDDFRRMEMAARDRY
jgi:hypothetical protein